MLGRAGIRAGGALALLALAGCDLGPTYKHPALDVPATYRGSPETAGGVWPEAEWWRGFGSPELDALIDQATAQNFDLAAAVARVRQADAQVRIAGAALLPSVNLTGDASWQRASFSGGGRRGSGGGSTTEILHSYSLGLNAAYQVDFWGNVRATRQAAVANAMFSRFDRQTVALTVVTDVATTWFTALTLADRLAAGTASALNEAQQEALVAGERAVIPQLTSQMEQQLIGLGILTGRPPEAITVRPGTLTTIALPPVAAGLPSALLDRRPDLAAAEAQLQAANYDVKAARAAFFPQVQLTGSAGFQNTALAVLFGPGGFIASLAAGLTQPLFDGGTLRGRLEQAKGREAELLADYRKAVVQAFTDVDNALTAWRYTTEQEALQRTAVETARRAAEIARAQMQAGTVDITTVLTAETTLFSAEDTLAQVRLARVQALVGLYKALGGGWTAPAGAPGGSFPGLSPGMVPGGVALPVGGNVK